VTNQLRFEFGGTAVLVTGGTSAIGHAIGGSGAHVTITGTRPDAGQCDRDLSSFPTGHSTCAPTGR
jgi:3-oxoacyl-[acyl-carrier protein] reductase